jgi:hypothetical protein
VVKILANFIKQKLNKHEVISILTSCLCTQKENQEMCIFQPHWSIQETQIEVVSSVLGIYIIVEIPYTYCWGKLKSRKPKLPIQRHLIIPSYILLWGASDINGTSRYRNHYNRIQMEQNWTWSKWILANIVGQLYILTILWIWRWQVTISSLHEFMVLKYFTMGVKQKFI